MTEHYLLHFKADDNLLVFLDFPFRFLLRLERRDSMLTNRLVKCLLINQQYKQMLLLFMAGFSQQMQ